jgi:hypothetical protein
MLATRGAVLQAKATHTPIYVSSYDYICVLILLCVLIRLYMCPHTTIYVSSYYYICVLIRLYMCPHTAICVLIRLYVSSYCYMCPHTTIYVSSYDCICVLILLYMCPHTTIYVSSSYLYLGGEVVETLATRGAVLQAKDTKGYCALHIAAERGNLEAIQVLTACSRMLTYAHVCWRMLTLLCAAHSSGEWQSRGHSGPYRMLTYAHVC